MLQVGMAQGVNLAHNRLQDIVNRLKQHTMTKSGMNPKVDFYFSKANLPAGKEESGRKNWSN